VFSVRKELTFYILIYIYTHTYISMYICKHEIYHCHYATANYHSNKLSSADTLHGRKFCSRSRTSGQYFVLVHHVYSLSIYTILMWICKV
jgi:hypothetical protein